MAKIDLDVSEYAREELFKPLVAKGQQWLTEGTSEQIATAASVVAKLDPTALRPSLPQLLKLAEQKTRQAGMRAMLASIKAYRNEEIESRQQDISDAKSKSEPEPWHPVPESYRMLPKQDSVITSASSNSKTDTPNATEVDALDDFFGSPALPEAIPEPSQVQEPMEAGARPSIINDLELAESLFGELPATPANPAEAPIADTASNKTERISLPSAWLARWQSADDRQKQPKWIRDGVSELRNRLEALAQIDDGQLASEDHHEQTYLRLVLLACGDMDQCSALEQELVAIARAQVESSRGEELQLIVEALPWLPESLRLQVIREVRVNFADWKLPSTRRILDAATEIDSRPIAAWLLEGFASLPAGESGQTAACSQIMMQSLIGTLAIDPNLTFGSSELKSSKDAFTAFNATRRLPAHDESLEWLGERYRATELPQIKAALLAVCSRFDHRLATQTSVGQIASAEVFDDLAKTALCIALCDREQSSCDWAAQFLGHSLPEIRHAAIDRLLKTGTEFAQSYLELGTVVYYDHHDHFPGLWHVQRAIANESLTTELNSNDESLRLQARLLLLSNSNEHNDATELTNLASVLKSESERTQLIAALVKAKRADEAALDIYRTATKDLESPAAIYSMLKSLQGDAILKIRNDIRKQYGSEAISL